MSQPLKVLLVDDDRAVLETMRILLESRGGFEVRSAIGAAGAAHCLTVNEHTDVVIADVVLAGQITGIDLCRSALQLHPRVALVLISADPTIDPASVPERCVYLRKPFGGGDLIAAIADAQRRATDAQVAVAA